MACAKFLDQLDLAGQMIWIIGPEAMEFIQQFIGDDLRLDMFHPMHNAMPDSPN